MHSREPLVLRLLMQLRFLGGAQEVGRSAIMLKDERTLMLDFGIKIDHKTEYPTSIPKMDAMIISHAHLDHSGFSAAVYNEMQVPTFGTLPTMQLSNLLLEDTLAIARKEHTRAFFHKRQIRSLMSRSINLDYHTQAHLGDFDIEFYDAGHISGSAITLIEKAHAKGNKRIVYTGDFKLQEQTLHSGAEVVKSDVLIMESTYATRDHPDRKKVIKRLIDQVKETLDNGGNALMPVFAVGRSQEVLSLLYENGLTPSTYIDGMARKATTIVMNHPKFISNQELLANAIKETTWIEERGARREALDGPSIIVTTAGMLNGGPVLDYITKLNKNSHIFLTGYQVEGTNGRTLMDKGYIMLDEQKTKINTPVSFYDLSAHADRKDLHEYVKRSAPNKVVCVHGSAENAKALADDLNVEGFTAVAPKVGDVVDID
ncbi:MAG TPA: MBL fold metallo-hydrolase [Candidatus Acidoferrum sp.]|nr:MBL fold metallo-hydrolase [Candidatus Acidoferrum sp.]